MSEAIKDWIFNIVIFMLFSSLMQQLTAEKKYEKYVRFFSGLLLVLLVISPVLKWLGSDSLMEFNYLEENFSQAAAYAAEEVDNIKLLQKELVSDKYGRQIQASLESILKNSGYELVDADIDLEDDEESANYLYPNKIFARIKGLHNEKESVVEEIIPVEIDGENEEAVSDDMTVLKKQIAEIFLMEEEDISIEVIG